VGIVAGLAGSITLTRVMSSLLYNTSARDAVTLSVVSALLAAVALAATIIPAHRALRVDPMIALRQE
jgi:ABC-type antimicrobial peptide transport system permease subunit